MSKLPLKYQWLETQPVPAMVQEGLKIYGTKEIVGKTHNPVIMGWAKELGLQSIYTNDELAWCGLSHAYVALKANKAIPLKGWDILRALQWVNFGIPVNKAMLGDTLIFKRDGGGHVGLYIGEDSTAYHVMGGNQGNAYNITRIAKNRLHAIRRPIYINQPLSVQVIALSATGTLSTNEA